MRMANPLEEEAHPAHQSGNRNVFCPFYKKCLDYAVEQHWRFFSCSVCPHRLRRVLPTNFPNTDDAEPGCQLQWEIYREVMFSLGCVRRVGHDSHGSE